LTTVIAVDPGNVSSAYVYIDADYRPLALAATGPDRNWWWDS
jgi:hypothetical protein